MSKSRPNSSQSRNTLNNLNRRDLLKGLAVMGGGSIITNDLLQTSPDLNTQDLSLQQKRLTYEDILKNAFERLSPTCQVCPVCNGVACSGNSGGIAGAGSGMSFQNNFTALQKVHLQMRNLHEVTKSDPSTTIFGHKISFPCVAAPMGPAGTKFGKGIPVLDWFGAIVNGCANAGTIGSVGDDPRYPEDEVKSRLAIIKQSGVNAFYNSKPAANPIILKWQPLIEESGAAWLSIDIDSGPKSMKELKEIVKAFRIPVIIKGIMTTDEAIKCADIGVAGIVVSNHGGRRLDHTPGTAEVLPEIAASLKGRIPIFVDGCVHSGHDVLKYLALGADVVMAGRHILRAAYGGGAEGVSLFMNRMRGEFEHAMVMTGVASVSQITSGVVNIA